MKLDESLKKLLTQAAQDYTAALPDSPAATYLQSRAIPLEVAERFQLGYVTNPHPSHEMFRGMLSIAYTTVTGVTGFKFRRLNDSGGPKYLAPTGQKMGMYNPTALLKYTPHVVICEGELDALTVHGVCGIPAVGVPGTGNWKPHFPRMFDGIKRVYVLADNDDKEDGSNPGQEFAKRILEQLPQAMNVVLPAGMDANSLVVSKGARAIHELLGLESHANAA